MENQILTQKDLDRINREYEIALLIKKYIKEEFLFKHYSGNIMLDENIRIKYNENEKGIDIEVKAPRYSFKKFQENGVIVKTYKGSYASQINREGSSIIIYDKNKDGTLSNHYFRKQLGNHIGFAEMSSVLGTKEYYENNQKEVVSAKWNMGIFEFKEPSEELYEENLEEGE